MIYNQLQVVCFVEFNMPNFDSPIGKKRFEGQQLKEFDVPDETGIEYPTEEQQVPVMRMRGPAPHGPQPPIDINSAMAFQQRQGPSAEEMADFERQVREAREAKRTGKVRLNDAAKRRVEMLLGMTRTTRQADVGGNKYAFQTLRSEEMRQAIMAASEFDGTVQSPFEIRRQLLARSITHVAGLDIAQFVGSNDLAARLQLIDELDEALLNRLYDEYLEMVKESREKYAIRTDAEVKELVEDLKK